VATRETEDPSLAAGSTFAEDSSGKAIRRNTNESAKLQKDAPVGNQRRFGGIRESQSYTVLQETCNPI